MTQTAIVVGTGAAGTSAAFRLHEAGVRVRMLESSDRVGGRMRTEHIDGYRVDSGACIIPKTYKEVLRLIRDAGHEDLLARAGATVAVPRNGKMHYLNIGLVNMVRSMLDTKLLSTRSKLIGTKIAVKLVRMSPTLGFYNLGKAGAHDIESIKDYANRSLNQELYDYILNPTQKLMYLVPADGTSVVDFFWSLKHLMSPVAYYAQGGMDQIPARICSRFDVRLGAEVLGVDEGADEVTVNWRDQEGVPHAETADMCVIATQPQIAARLDKGLDPDSHEYLTKLRYSRFVNMHLRLKRKPDEKAVLIMAPDEIDDELCGVLLEHNKAPDRAPNGKGAIGVYFLDGFAQRTFDLTDEQIFEIAMPKVERLMPGLTDLVEGYHIQRWELGGTYAAPGDYRKLGEFVRKLDVDRRVQLAGDYYSLACLNGATTAGLVAARNLIGRYVPGASRRSARKPR